MSPPKSFRSSIESQSSIRTSSRQLKTISELVEYEFGKESGEGTQQASSVSWAATSSDYCRFQELIMGQDVQMPFHGPVQKITAKRSSALTCTTICERQNLRLWKYPCRHTLMFYANMDMSDTIKEYDCEKSTPAGSPVLIVQCNISAQSRQSPRRRSGLMSRFRKSQDEARAQLL